MRILKDIGEIGIHTDKRDVILRPSLYAMSELGSPREIVEIVSLVCEGAISEHDERAQMIAARSVLASCTEEDISDLVGYWTEDSFVRGAMEPEDILVIARSLLRHGVVGALPAEEGRGDDREPEYVAEFDARGYVATVMAHLGLSENDAWQMTMTAALGALRAKYPPQPSDGPGGRSPTAKEHEATMREYDKIDAIRKQQAAASEGS